MKALRMCLALGAIFVLPGCQQMIQDHSMAKRNDLWAWRAWILESPAYRGLRPDVRHHVRCGFHDGYVDVASGSDGTVPMFPPQCYWGVWFQNPRGKDLVQAWFNGYQDGAIAAERDGIAYMSEIPTSAGPEMRGQQPPQGERLPEGPWLEGEPVPEGIPSSAVSWGSPGSAESLRIPGGGEMPLDSQGAPPAMIVPSEIMLPTR